MENQDPNLDPTQQPAAPASPQPLATPQEAPQAAMPAMPASPVTAPSDPSPAPAAPSQFGVVSAPPQTGAMPQPAPQPGTQPFTPQSFNSQTAKGKKKAMAVVLSGLAVLILAAAALLYFLVFTKHISAKDVSNAQTATTALSDDVSSISSSFGGNPNTEAEANKAISTAQNSFNDAKKQYAILQKSNVLKDNNVDSKFKALSTKWNPYATYVSEDIQDLQAIFPPLYKFADDANSLANTSPSTVAQLKTYLTNFQQITNTALSQLNGAKVLLPENQQGLTASRSYLATVSKDITAAQNDINAGRLSSVETDLSSLDSGSSAFQKAMDSADTKSNQHEQQLDPSTEIGNFQSALDKLQAQVGTK